LGPRVNELDLRQITLGGEITDEQILERLRKTYPGALVSHIYASTEAGALFSVRDGLAGFPASWLETGVDGLLLRIQHGVLQVKSPRSMDGYVGLDSSRILTSDGWLITGDLVEVVGERVLFRGRKDLMLNVGGAKVRPEEVEQALLSLPEVVDAQVYGARNPLTGFLVAANVVPRAGIAEADLRVAILTQLRAKLEAYKVPRKLRFVDSISMSISGKKEKPM
ncbi:MAG: AMP-binding enzyme, partial [Acidimicrobiia bacterium]